MFRHPKYYKELRKRNKSDQVISPRVATASARRASGPGQQLGEVQPCDREATPSSKPQASSNKLKETHAASDKLPNLQALIKFQATSIRGLDYNKTVFRMAYMEGNLVW